MSTFIATILIMIAGINNPVPSQNPLPPAPPPGQIVIDDVMNL